MRVPAILAAAALAGILLTAPAAQAASAGPRPADTSELDRQYLNRAHQDNLFEIITGDLAASKGLCPQVRTLGAEFADHHLALDADLIAVSAREGVPLAGSPDPGQLGEIAGLVIRSGPDFDLTWLQDQIDVHVRDLKLGELELTFGWSPEVKRLALEAAPVLQHHLDETTAALATCTTPR